MAEAGLSVVIADLDAAALVTAEADVGAATPIGADVIAVPTDVSNTDSVANLAETAFKAGEIAVLMTPTTPQAFAKHEAAK